jgi:CRP-like cAMP-binding protein
MDVKDDVVGIIAGFSLFAGLSSPELDLIARVFEEAWFGEGDRILRQGFTGSSFYIILEGTAGIHVNGVARDMLRPGDFFGEISCLLGVSPTADIVAESAMRCLVLPAAELEPFLVANPRVMYKVLQGEARKLRSTIGWHS